MLNVLIVDDNYEYLEKAFNEINDKFDDSIKISKICNDGEKALEFIMKENIDIILLDLNLPKIDGIQILEKIKKNRISSKVIVISGEPNLIIDIINKNLEVEHILLKPFKMVDLIDRINKIISVNKENKELENNKIEKIDKLLSNFNFNKCNVGYLYIKDCLNLCVEKKLNFIPQMNSLYKEVSKLYDNIDYANVAWNISKAIQTMNQLTQKEVLNRYFPYNIAPSPKIFLNEMLHIYNTYN